ncbi:MAG: hypothetical protein U1E19_13100 [Rhodoblastus sp.]
MPAARLGDRLRHVGTQRVAEGDEALETEGLAFRSCGQIEIRAGRDGQNAQALAGKFIERGADLRALSLIHPAQAFDSFRRALCRRHHARPAPPRLREGQQLRTQRIGA